MTIEDYSSLFTTIRHYSHCSHYSLFAIPTVRTIRCSLFALFVVFAIRYSRLFAVRYSRLFTIRYSGFPDTPFFTLKYIPSKFICSCSEITLNQHSNMQCLPIQTEIEITFWLKNEISSSYKALSVLRHGCVCWSIPSHSVKAFSNFFVSVMF